MVLGVRRENWGIDLGKTWEPTDCLDNFSPKGFEEKQKKTKNYERFIEEFEEGECVTGNTFIRKKEICKYTEVSKIIDYVQLKGLKKKKIALRWEQGAYLNPIW